MIEESINIIKHGIASLLAVFNTQEVETIIAGNVEIIKNNIHIEQSKNKVIVKPLQYFSSKRYGIVGVDIDKPNCSTCGSRTHKSQECEMHTIDKKYLYSEYDAKKIIAKIDIKINICDKLEKELYTEQQLQNNLLANVDYDISDYFKSERKIVELEEEIVLKETDVDNYINKIKKGLLISRENEKKINKNVNNVLKIHNIPHEICNLIALFVYITPKKLKICGDQYICYTD